MFILNRIICVFLLLSASCSEAHVSEEKITGTFSGKTEVATFSGGSFGYLEATFESLDGIVTVYSGYAGGNGEKPLPSALRSGNTGHKEAIQITFDPDVISYSELLAIYWQLIDPTDGGGSFQNRGSQYASAVYYRSAKQKAVAELSKKTLDNSGIFHLPVVTPVVKHTHFYKAEDVHQDDHPENSVISNKSVRDLFIADHWEIPSADQYAAPSKTVLKQKLTEIQYQVTQEGVTERAFHNPYDGNKRQGIYICIVSGSPLFSSKDKFDSKTGWPSFTKPIDARFLTKKIDYSHGMTRVEVRSKFGDAHGGHVFSDGPPPTGLRYCMNSASLEFIPKEEMEKRGYGLYLWLVD